MEAFNPLWILVGAAVVTFIFQAGGWYKNVNSDRDRFKAFMDEVRTELKDVHAKLNRILGGMTYPVTTKESPAILTKEGADLSDCIDAKTIVDKLAAGLFPRIKGKDKYQVQEFCEDYFMDECKPGADVEREWRECAYERGLKMHHVHLVLAVELRDKLLSMRGRPGV